MTMPSLRLRPSNADRAFACPGSLYPKEHEPLIEVLSDDASAIGRAGHHCLALHSQHMPVDLDDIAANFKVKVDDIKYLSYSAAQFVEWLEDEFDVAEWVSEKRISSAEIVDGVAIAGTPDLIGITRDGKTIIVFDFKTGRVDSSHEHQLRCYGLAAIDTYPNTVENVIALIGWARDFDIQKWEWSRADMDEWVKDVIKTIFEWDGINYTVGEHCTFCRRHASCEARELEMRSGYRMMLVECADDVPDGPLALTGEQLATAWEMSKSIPKVIEHWRARIKERIRATGPLDLGNGKVLDVVERNSAPEIDTVKAAAVLKAGFSFTDEDVLSVSKIGKKAMEELIGSRQKGTSKKAVVDALTEHDALIPKTSMTITTKAKEITNGAS